MQRKIIKNNEISEKPFLMILIKIFNDIQIELKKLPTFKCKHFLELKGINQSYLNKNVAERLIKKEHEVKLFRQTYDEIRMINKKKTKARSADIVMKFSLVSDILLNRMKEQLCIKGEAKQLLINNLHQLKESFMNWEQSMGPASKNRSKNPTSHSKVTDDYTLKYVFSELTTTIGTANNSRSVSKRKQTLNPKQQMQEGQSLEEELLSKLKDLQKRHQRHTINYLRDRKSQRSSTKKYTKTFINTEYDKKQNQLHIESQQSVQSKETKEDLPAKLKKKTTFFENDQSSNLNEAQEQNQQISQCPYDSIVMPSEQEEAKKSAYFQSQNYIKSRKIIDNITHFVNPIKRKTIKRISNYLSSVTDKEVLCSDNNIEDMTFLEPTTYKSRKYLTRKYIPDEPRPYVQTSKSEKALNHRPTTSKNTSPIPHHYQRKTGSRRIKNSGDPYELRFYGTQMQKKKFISIKDDIPKAFVAEFKAASGGDGKHMGQFYAELGLLRSELKKETSPSCQTRSDFFHQQGALWEEEKRRMQRLLDERERQLYFREFEMACTMSNRDEEQALKVIRDDFVNFTQKLTGKHHRNSKLNQIDLSKQKEPI